MASLRRAILALTLMGTVRVHGWDMWDLGRWSSVENDSASWDSLGGLSDVPEGEPVTDDVALNNTTYQLDAGDGFDDQSTPGLSHSPDVPSNDSYSGTDEGGERKEGGDESEGFGHQWLQKTMDFLSGLLSAPESGTDETNSTEIDGLQPDNLCLNGNTLSNCSSESVTPDQQLEDEELEEPDGDYPLTASMDTTASSEPTWIDASARCLRESMDRSDGRCDWEEGRTLEGALIDIFNDTIVKRLMKKCLPGEWCLHKHFSKHQTLAGHRSCHLMSCLEDWRDGNCPPTKVIWDALNLLCSLTNESTSDPCFISVLKMIHVTIADMIRVAVQPEVEESVCSEGNRDCSGPCQKVGQSLLCMSASCDNNTYQFESFGEWQWLFGQSGSADEKCQFNASECQLIETVFTMTSHDTAVMPHQGPRRLLTFLKDTEWSIIAGLILSVIFSLLVVCGIFLALRCSGRRRLRRRMMLRHKTMDRDDAGLTRDRIQYTIITTQQDDFDDQDSDDMA